MMTDSTDRISGLRMLRKGARWLGLWKWKNENGTFGLIKRNYRFALHFPLTFTYVTLMWIEALGSSNLEQAGQLLYMSLTEVAMITKLINIWWKREQAHHFINELEKHEAYELRNRDENLLWHIEQIKFKRIFYSFIGCSLIVVWSGFISVLLMDTYVLPFSYYVPFEWRKPERYYYAWAYNVMAMTLTCICNATLDAMGCYFMLQIGMLYRILNLRLSGLFQAPEIAAKSELSRIFNLHKRLRRLTQECEILVSPYVLSQVLLSAFIICFSAYKLVQMDWREAPGPFITTVQFLAVMIFEIYLPCYYGNEVTIHASTLTNAVFDTNWVEYSYGTRKLLNMYMEHLKPPVQLRAGSFFQIGLPIFVKTINNAYSFFALLLNMSK